MLASTWPKSVRVLAPEKLTSQKERSLPTIMLWGAKLVFVGVIRVVSRGLGW